MKLEATKGGSRKKRTRKQKAGTAPYPKVFEGSQTNYSKILKF